MYHLSFADQIISFSKSNRAFHPLLALSPPTSTYATLCFKSPHNKTLKTNQYIVQNVAQQCVAHKLAISFSSLISAEKFHSPVCAPVKRFSLSPPCKCRRMKGSNLPFWHIINIQHQCQHHHTFIGFCCFIWFCCFICFFLQVVCVEAQASDLSPSVSATCSQGFMRVSNIY